MNNDILQGWQKAWSPFFCRLKSPKPWVDIWLRQKTWKRERFSSKVPYHCLALLGWTTLGYKRFFYHIFFAEAPLVVGPVTVTPPVCLHCYVPVDGSFKCRKSGWVLKSTSQLCHHYPLWFRLLLFFKWLHYIKPDTCLVAFLYYVFFSW